MKKDKSFITRLAPAIFGLVATSSINLVYASSSLTIPKDLLYACPGDKPVCDEVSKMQVSGFTPAVRKSFHETTVRPGTIEFIGAGVFYSDECSAYLVGGSLSANCRYSRTGTGLNVTGHCSCFIN